MHGSTELPEPLRRYTPTPADPFDWRKAAHLLRRAGFGGKEHEIAAAVAAGPDQTVDRLLAFGDDPLPEFGTAPLPGGELSQVWHVVADQRAVWLHEMACGGHPLREKLALFWHDHFSVGARHDYLRSHMLPHVNVLRRHGAGRMEELFAALLRDPAMLIWLDNWSNGRPVDGQPQVNLNWAREIFELHTMGVNGGYRQRDVLEAARCLSGWGIVSGLTTNALAWRPEWHVPGPKVVLGSIIDNQDGRRDARQLIEVLLRWPRTAEFLVAKLWRFFVSDPMPAGLVAPLAAWWRARRLDVGALLRLLFRSRWFHSDAAIRALVKNPIELAVGAVRQLGGERVVRWRGLGAAVARLGWRFLEYFTPAGVEDGIAWLSTQTVVERVRFAHALVHGAEGLGAAVPLDSAWHDPEAMLRRLVDGAAGEALRRHCRELCSAGEVGRRSAIAALLCSAEYQVN